MSKYIELTGSPCAGKSTLIGELKRYSSVEIVDDSTVPKCLNMMTRSRIINMILSEVILVIYGMFAAGTFARKGLYVVLFDSDSGFVRRLNVVRNILKKYAITEIITASNSEKIYILDEGVSHIPFLFPDKQHGEDILVLMKGRKHKPLYVLCVTADQKVIRERLKNRGHAQLKNERYELDEFVASNELCRLYLAKIYGKCGNFKEYESTSSVDEFWNSLTCEYMDQRKI